jgi:hypothetical protein
MPRAAENATLWLPRGFRLQAEDSTGLNERYVREWLGAMVTGGIVEYDAG